VVEILTKRPPTTLLDINAFRGIGKKTGCLYLQAVYNLVAGIIVDLHVKKKAQSLGWVPVCDDATVISYMLEKWIPHPLWRSVNTRIARSCQITQMKQGDLDATFVQRAASQLRNAEDWDALSVL
jgi:endonuclease III